MAISLPAAMVLSITIGLLAAAYTAARAHRVAIALACLIAAGATIRAYAASERQLHGWDERFHVVVAKHLIRHPLTPTLYDDPVLSYDYRDWTANHVWLHKPPLTLWLMASSLRLFGLTEPAARLPSVMLSSLAIVLTFAIGRRLFDTQTGLLAAGFHTVNGLLVALVSGRASTDHVDTLLIVLTELAVFIAIRKRERDHLRAPVAAGLVLGLAALTKWYPALLILPLWFYLEMTHRSIREAMVSTLIVVAAGTVVVGPWTWHIMRAFPREAAWEWQYGLAHATYALEDHRSGPLFFVVEMPKFFGELVFIPLACAATYAARHSSIGLRLALLWIAVTYLAFSVVATKGSAYVMVAAPAVFLIEAWFLVALANNGRLSRIRPLRVVLLVLFAFLPGRYLLRPGGPFTISHQRPEWVSTIEGLRNRVTAPHPVLFNVPHAIEAMFYLPWPSYERMPTNDEVVSLRTRGYSVILYDTFSGVVPAPSTSGAQ